jgi:hypothetical protein
MEHFDSRSDWANATRSTRSHWVCGGNPHLRLTADHAYDKHTSSSTTTTIIPAIDYDDDVIGNETQREHMDAQGVLHTALKSHHWSQLQIIVCIRRTRAGIANARWSIMVQIFGLCYQHFDTSSPVAHRYSQFQKHLWTRPGNSMMGKPTTSTNNPQI